LLSLGSVVLRSFEETNESYSTEMIEIYDYIKKNIPDNDIIAFKKPRVLWLFTGRRSVSIKLADFKSSVASYILVQKKDNGTPDEHKILKEFNHYFLIEK
jgi:hypothetical protein